MDYASLLKQDALIIDSETPPIDMLQAGVLHIRQGNYATGLAFLSHARERLSPEQAYLTTALDTLVQSHMMYTKAQDVLLQASRHFTSAEAKQQTHLMMLEKLLHSPTPAEPQSTLSTSNDAQQQTNSQSRLPLAPPQLEQTSSLTKSTSFPPLYITCFGHFVVKRLGKSVVLCSNRQGQAILRYLTAQPDHRATSDILMTLLWPDDASEAVQSRLHTAICALRRSLNHDYTCEPGRGYIICENRTYFLNTAIPIQTDVDQFLHNNQLGRQSPEERIAHYEKACLLYTGPFLLEDTYADWSSLQREHLSHLYIEMCRVLTAHYLQTKSYQDAEKWATALLKENRCDELAHQYLIQIYAAQGQRSEVWQQYQRCERILREELAVPPLPETTRIAHMLLKNDTSLEFTPTAEI